MGLIRAVERDTEIRILAPQDIPALRGLMEVFAKAFGEPGTYLGAPPSDGYLGELLGKPHFIAIAAMAGGSVVGGLAAYQFDKFEQDRREIYIYDLAVDEAHRRRGIATALMDGIRAEAVRRDAYAVFVQADRGDVPALSLYARLGTMETVHHFDIAPSGGAGTPEG